MYNGYQKEKKKPFDVSLLGERPYVPGTMEPIQGVNPNASGIRRMLMSHDTVINELFERPMTAIEAVFFYGSIGLLDATNLADIPIWKRKGFTYKVAIGLMLGRALTAGALIGIVFDPLEKYTGSEEGEPMSPGIAYYQEIVDPIGSPQPLSWVFDKWTRRGIYG